MTSATQPTVALTRAEPGALFPLTADARFLRHLVAYEGCPFATLEGRSGDILFHFGRRALFHLEPEHARLRCAFTTFPDPVSERVLLDTVLWTTSLQLGFELLHASAVTTDGGVLALVADQGGGKSTLAAEFLRRGATLFADDVVALEATGDTVLGHCGPAVMNLPVAVDEATVGSVTVLARFEDERWVQLPAVAQPPAPLSAIVLLRRSAGESLQCRLIPATTLTLLPFAIALPHMTARGRRRFDRFGQLAAVTPVLELTADLTTPVADLADAVQLQVETL
ncbi:MAG TPA: hypothetical protein VG325_20140 [Solirubrobacteraceae bacterium]|nr:hypothetical protein [Solirubrobacteraceae bacterium]